jgi:hypothetical protein
MTDWQLKTPVALIIFNRPDTTEKVFEKIRQAKPPLLLVVADGPREEKPGEAQKCAATRAIIDRVDWNCEVLKNYSEINLGCGRRPATGLDWVFDTVEEAIVLEDDCIPHPTFFRYCEELLDYYRDDERVMAVCGSNIQFGRHRTEYSYYFSHYSLCWGWASWRRAWKYFDFDLKVWPEVRDKNLLIDILGDAHAAKVWHQTLQMTYDKLLECWDFQWTFANFIQRGLSIIPHVNLISNIGYTQEATHTKEEDSPYNQMLIEVMDFPLKHPPFIVRNVQADRFTEYTLYDYQPNLLKRVNQRLKKVLKSTFPKIKFS